MGAGHATTSSTANLVLVSISKVRFYSSKGNNFIHQLGPSYSKHHQLNELVNDKLVICCSLGIFKYVDIFVAKATHIFFQQKISMYLPYFMIENLTLRSLTTSLSFEQLDPAK